MPDALLRDPRWGLALAVVVGVGLVLTATALGLAALLLAVRYRSRRSERMFERLRSTWELAVVRIVNGRGEARELWELVAPNAHAIVLPYLLRFAERLRDEPLERLRVAAQPFLEPAVQDLSNRLPEVRAGAVRTLEVLGGRAHLPALRSALYDPAPLVAITAAQALSRFDDPGLAGEIVEHVDEWTTWDTRFLGSILATPQPMGLAVLRSVLLDPRAPPRRVAVAATALRLSGDTEASGAATAALRSGRFQEREPIAELLRLLAVTGDPANAETVRRFLGSPDEAIRSQATFAFGRLAEEPCSELMSAAGDPSPWVALNAVRALAHREARAELSRLAASERSGAPFARQVLDREAG